MVNQGVPFTSIAKKQFSQLLTITASSDAYELRGTLDAYEVEELDGHDLARFLPTILSGAKGKEEDSRRLKRS